MLSRPTSGGQGTDELLKQRITCWLIKHQSAKREALKKQQTNRKKKTKKQTFLYSSSFHSIEVYRQECFFVFLFFSFSAFSSQFITKRERRETWEERDCFIFYRLFSFFVLTADAGGWATTRMPPTTRMRIFAFFAFH